MAKRCELDDLERVFNDYRNMVFRTAYLVIGDADEAEDVLQEVFIKVYRSWGTYDPKKGGLAVWLRRITVNHCISEHRRKHLPSTSLDNLTEQGFDPPDDCQEIPEELLIKKEEGTRVWRAMQLLDEKHRVVVVLRYSEGLSYEEIAQLLDIPLGTVRSRLNAAMSVLRRELVVEGVES